VALASQPRTRQRAGSHWKEEARATLFSTFNSRIQPWLEYHRTGRRRRTPFCVAISFTSRDLKGTPPYGTQPGERFKASGALAVRYWRLRARSTPRGSGRGAAY